MFDDEANEYTRKQKIISGDRFVKKAFKDGAEYGYKKGFEFGVKSNEKVNQIVANEWHYPSKGEYPELNKTCVAKYGKNIAVIEFVNECQFKMIEYWKYCDLPKEIE